MIVSWRVGDLGFLGGLSLVARVFGFNLLNLGFDVLLDVIFFLSNKPGRF